MNIHISKQTQFELLKKKPIFGEYPLFIRKGSFTVTLFFKDKEAVTVLMNILSDMKQDIENYELDKNLQSYEDHTVF
ncbi:MAG: hypothetical protein ACOC2I_03930 [Halanaerobium sp.]